MGRNNFVYEDLLKSYLKVRTAKKEKEQNATTKIAEAEKSIEDNKQKMAAAITSGDQETYTNLYAANSKNEASIQFFRGVLDMLKKEDTAKDIDAADLQRKASNEIAKIIEQYNIELVKLMQPIIELSASTAAQVNILRLAKANIARNIENGSEFSISQECKQYSYVGIDLMRELDKILQSEAYKSSAKIPHTPYGADRYKWDAEATEKYNKEVIKWI